MTLYERWNKEGRKVVCEKEAVKAMEDVGYTFEIAPGMEAVKAEVVIQAEEEVVVPVAAPVVEVHTEEVKKGRKKKDEADEKSVPDIIL